MKILSDGGHLEAIYESAEMLLHGEGVLQDIELAVTYLKRAAQEGLASAQSQYGFTLAAAKQYEEAEIWFKRASVQKDHWGMYFYASITSDKKVALFYLNKLADLNFPPALATRGLLKIFDSNSFFDKNGLDDLTLASDYGYSRSSPILASLLLFALGSEFSLPQNEEERVKIYKVLLRAYRENNDPIFIDGLERLKNSISASALRDGNDHESKYLEPKFKTRHGHASFFIMPHYLCEIRGQALIDLLMTTELFFLKTCN